MKKLLCLLFCFCSSLVMAADTNTSTSIMMREELSTFASLVATANLQDFFNGTGPFTSFLPSNKAFENFSQSKLADLRDEKNRDELIDFINYHVIHGKYMSQSLKPGSVRTLNGKNITIRIEGDQIWVNDVKVVKKDLVGPNGVSYIIDSVLTP